MQKYNNIENGKIKFRYQVSKNFETAYKVHNTSQKMRRKDKNMHKIKLDEKIKI